MNTEQIKRLTEVIVKNRLEEAVLDIQEQLKNFDKRLSHIESLFHPLETAENKSTFETFPLNDLKTISYPFEEPEEYKSNEIFAPKNLDLLNSSKTTTKRKAGNHQCEICGRIFPVPSKLIRHQTMHTGEKAFQCDLCTNCYTRGETLKNHIKLVHSEAKI